MKQRNGWFTAAGVLSILGSISMYLLALIFTFTLIMAATQGDMTITDPNTGENLQVPVGAIIGPIIGLVIMFLVFAIIMTICAKNCMKFRNMDAKELENNSRKVITTIVLLFIFGGVLTGVFALVGYFSMKNVNVQVVDGQVGTASSQAQKLEEIKKMYEHGTITESEYQDMRENILKNFVEK